MMIYSYRQKLDRLSGVKQKNSFLHKNFTYIILMKKDIEKNKNIFRLCGVPFIEINDQDILIKTANTDYCISMSPLVNNPFVLKVYDKAAEKTEMVSKDVLLRKLCRYFKLEFKHWDSKVNANQETYVKLMPGEIKVGGEYTTTWANPVAKWILKEIVDEQDVILSSPKTGRETMAKYSDLRVWFKQK